MNRFIRNLIVLFAIFLVVAGIFSFFSTDEKGAEQVSVSQVALEVNNGAVERIEVSGDRLLVFLKDGTKQQANKEKEVAFSESLKNYGVTAERIKEVKIEVKEGSSTSFLLSTILPFLIPFLIIAAFIWFLMRQVAGTNNRALTFGQSGVKLLEQSDRRKRVTFDDIAGVKEAKEELKEIVEFLRFPQKFYSLGARIPKGVLLLGPPGVGKTLIARAIAGEANVPFFHISGSEFVEMFVGVGASVTGDTPVLIRDKKLTKLLPIAEFVDEYYSEDEAGIVKPVTQIQTLGFRPLTTKFWGGNSKDKKFFGGSQWTSVSAVFRHKVDKIYEIHFRGGVISITADHSIFVRSGNMIESKKASKLKTGETLVNLPFKVRSQFVTGIGTTHKIRSHEFPKEVNLELDLYDEKLMAEKSKLAFVVANRSTMSQQAIAQTLGMSQTTVKNWQLGYHRPQFLNANVVANHTPTKVKVTLAVMKLLGLYTAEGRTTDYYTQFVFGLHEKKLHQECMTLIRDIFKLGPSLTEVLESNSVRINISSPVVAEFFARHCGNGSHHKHVPEFIWDLPREYFLAYLEGYAKGDGYTTKEGKLSTTSVSRQLVRELAWLCSMHGIGVGVRQTVAPAGRLIGKGHPLPETRAWNLIISKTSHPFLARAKSPDQWKKPIITRIVEKPYEGYVYDLCGCENEAFFGGEKPVLLHNSRVRDLFKKAKKNAPCIVFIDEIDAVGRQRGAGLGGSHDEREQTLNQILVEMDGFEQETNVIVVAATNRPDVLDPALLRPGRFDRQVILDQPDISDREAILKIHAKGKPLAKLVNLRQVAERTPGFSGADLENLMNEGAILAARRNLKQITQTELIEAIEKVMLGPERKSHLLSIREKEIAAWHEAGHALVATVLPSADPVHKVSIVSRGRAAGYTMKLPTEDRQLHSKSEFLADLAVSMGGYAAEKLIFDELTTGAANDLKTASNLARKLVTAYGMSETLGPMTFGEHHDLIFLGREIAESKNYSEKIAAKIDQEVAGFIDRAYKTATDILKRYKKYLTAVAKKLIEIETIEREQFEQLVSDIIPKDKLLKKPKLSAGLEVPA